MVYAKQGMSHLLTGRLIPYSHKTGKLPAKCTAARLFSMTATSRRLRNTKLRKKISLRLSPKDGQKSAIRENSGA